MLVTKPALAENSYKIILFPLYTELFNFYMNNKMNVLKNLKQNLKPNYRYGSGYLNLLIFDNVLKTSLRTWIEKEIVT